jgi:hypothetical protein
MRISRILSIASALIATSTTVGTAQIAFDGDLDFTPSGEWDTPDASATQDNYTEFGNQILSGFSGSELDELYVRTDGTYLYLGITGNLEQNGNAIAVLLDMQAGVGQQTLQTEITPVAGEACSTIGPPFAVPNFGFPLATDDGGTPDDPTDDLTIRSTDPGATATILDSGFAPEFIIAVDTFGGDVFVTQYDLSDQNVPIGTDWDDPGTNNDPETPCFDRIEALSYYATRRYLGTVAVESGSGVLTGGDNPNNSQYAFDNSAFAGVTDTAVATPGSGNPGDPRTQTRGLEARIHLADLGLTPPVDTLEFNAMVILAAGNGSISNQTLPGVGRGTDTTNLDLRPDFSDAGVAAGNQFVAVSLSKDLAFSPTIDGDVASDFVVADVAASQDTVTGFGDHPQNPDLASPGSELDQLFVTQDAPIGGSEEGSELDELYARTDGTYLYLGVTGNLRFNGNAQIILIDADPGADPGNGQNTLASEIAPVVAELPCSGNGPPVAVQGLGQALENIGGLTVRSVDTTATVLDAGFNPDYAISYDTFGGTLFVTQYSLSGTSLGNWDDPATNGDGSGGPCSADIESLPYYATRVYRGSIPVGQTGTLTGGDNPNGSRFAYDNSGTEGVTLTTVAAPGSALPGDPRSQTTGLEAKIHLADLGFTTPVAGSLDLEIMVLLTGDTGFVSNQTLPGTGAGTNPAHLGVRPDFATGVAGSQFAFVSLAPAAFSPTLDGKNIVGDFGVGNVAASQDSVTSFADHTAIQRLLIGITGNLQTNGNDLVIFADTLAGLGEGLTTALDDQGGGTRISGLVGDKIPLDADYAININTGDGANAYIDLIDLNSDTSTYVGPNGIGSGEGVLDNGAPDWRLALRNDNIVGVDDNPANDPVPQSSQAQTAVTGFELAVPLSAIGNPAVDDEICLFALVKGGGFLSNQFLPAGIGGAWPNFGNPPVDLTVFGYSCLPVTIRQVNPCNDPPQDADGDGDVDLTDYGQFLSCYAGPENPWLGPDALCACFDADNDLDVDLSDYGIFLGCYNGPENPPACP